jgi:hypothetical protein
VLEPPGRHIVQDARRNGQDAYHPEEVSHSKIGILLAEMVPVCTLLFRHYVEEFRTELFLVVNKMVYRGLQPDTVPTQALVHAFRKATQL